MGGCVGDANRGDRVTMNALVDQVMRVKLTAELQQVKYQKELKIQEDLLI
jgi:hypothetical protein